MKRYLSELNEGSVRKERGKISLSKLKIWWKNERQREKRIQNREMEKASQTDKSGIQTDREKNERDVYVDDSDDVIVYDARHETTCNMRGSNDPLLGAPSPHGQDLGVPSPHRHSIDMPSPHRNELCSQSLQRNEMVVPSSFKHDLDGSMLSPYRHDLAAGAPLAGTQNPYRHDLGASSMHPGEYVHIVQIDHQDYQTQVDRSTEHQS